MRPIFVTGNQNKADQVAAWLGMPIEHRKLDLDELQSLNLLEVVEHKARQAHGIINRPVLVEDCGLGFEALGGLPGPFIKWFEKPGYEALCRMLDGFDDRRAVAHLAYGLFDGKTIRFFEGEMQGTIAHKPAGTRGFGWDVIFIHDGQTKTRGELDEEMWSKLSYRKQTVYKLAEYLKTSGLAA